MKFLVVVVLLLLSGCCTTENVMHTEKIPYAPDGVVDSLKTLLQTRVRPDCDSVIAEIIQQFANFNDTSTSVAGDRWAVTVKTLLDSVGTLKDSLSKVKRYTRSTLIDVKPHIDTLTVAYLVKEIKPLSLGDRIRIAAFWPLLILWLGTVLMFGLTIAIITGKLKLPF